MSKEKLEFGIEVNDEELQDAVDKIREHNVSRPNIIFRNNDNVMVTINYWNNEPKDEEVE